MLKTAASLFMLAMRTRCDISLNVASGEGLLAVAISYVTLNKTRPSEIYSLKFAELYPGGESGSVIVG